MTRKQPINIELSPSALSFLRRFRKDYRLSLSASIDLALRLLYLHTEAHEEKVPIKKNNAPINITELSPSSVAKRKSIRHG